MTSPTDRGCIEFTDGTRWYAKPRERPCVCIEGVQQCGYHALAERQSAQEDT